MVGHRCLGGRETGDVAGRVIAQALTEHGATGAAAALPGGAGTERTQIGIVSKLIGGQCSAGGGLEVDGVELRPGVVDQRRQVTPFLVALDERSTQVSKSAEISP